MSANNELNKELEDDKILENSQKIRNELVKSIIKDGMPTDKDDKYILLGALKDMDKQVIDKKKVAIEDKNANVAGVIAEAVSKISQLVDGGDPFKRPGSGQIPSLDNTLIPEYSPVDGEMEVGITNDNYDNFMSHNGKNSKKDQ